MFDPKLKEALSHVQKPGRYTGGEPGSVYKEKEKRRKKWMSALPSAFLIPMRWVCPFWGKRSSMSS